MPLSKKPYYLVHLEDDQLAQGDFALFFKRRLRFEIVEYIEKTFLMKDYWICKERFAENQNYGIPTFDIELVQVSSILELKDKLFPNGNQKPSEIACSTLFFILDFFIPEKPGDTESNLFEATVNNLPFKDWLHSLMPNTPIVMLTRFGAKDLVEFLPNNWKFQTKDLLDNHHQFEIVLKQYFDSWWKPVFSDALFEYGQNSSMSWHTPGHNAGNAFLRSPIQNGFFRSYEKHSFTTDLSVSVDKLGDLSEPDRDSPLKEAMKLSSDIFGAEDTFYVTNGTSTSNKAMLMTLLRPGEYVLLDRNCHKSVHQAVVMSGAIPIYMKPVYNKTLGVWLPIDGPTIKKHLNKSYDEDKKPRLLVLTTCTYEGILYPIHKIKKWCEDNGILLFSDEAWAPYLRFHPHYGNNYCAMDGGAHFSVQSTHKALAAFSQASMIHVSKSFKRILESDSGQWDWLRKRFSFQGSGNYERFRHSLFEVLRYWHSTSPNYPMMAALDRASIQMRLEGMKLLDERLKWAEDFNQFCSSLANGCSLDLAGIVSKYRVNLYEDYLKDPLKLVIATNSSDQCVKLKQTLSSNYIQWEKASNRCIEFLITIGTYNDHIQKLKMTLAHNKDLLGMPVYSKTSFDNDLSDVLLKVQPQYAAFCEGEMVELKNSAGRIGAQMLVPYPPGIPLVLPGFEISKRIVSYVRKIIQNNGYHDVHGICVDDGKCFVKVITKQEYKKCPNDKKYYEIT
jgi:arginine decarboxylase